MLRQVCQSYIQPVKGKFLNTFFSKSTFLFFLCFGAKTIRTSGKIFRQGFQNSFLCVQRTIWEIKKWTKTFVNFIITSDFKQKSFRILAKFFARLVKSVFYLSGIKFWEKISSERFCFHSLNISIAWPKQFLEFWLKIIGRLVETAFHASRGTFWEIFFQVRKLESLKNVRNWTEEFLTLTRSFRQFRQNCNLPVQKNVLIKSIFSKELLFQNYFRISSKNFSAICQKTSGRVVKSALYLSTGTFLENNFFVGKFFSFWILQTLSLNVLDFIRKSFWPSRQNCNLLVQMNILRKFFSKHFVFLNHFWYLTNLLRPFF